jgi:hypothetical protein
MTAFEEDDVSDQLDAIEAAIARLVAVSTCPRCTQPPPPPERWPGDARARDDRRPHTCGRPRWSR